MIYNNAIVTLTGNLGKTPDIRTNDNGEYCFISIATQDTFQDPSGQYFRNSTVWHRVGVYNDTILQRLKQLPKGKRITVEATLDYYKSMVLKDGEERRIDEPKLTAISLAEAPISTVTDDSIDTDQAATF